MKESIFFKRLPFILGIIAIIPVLIVMTEYWYISNFFTKDLILTKSSCWIIAIACGTIAGVAFNWQKDNLTKRILVGAISGCITGYASIWVAGGYLYLRGFPSSLLQFEFIFISAILILIGFSISNVLDKLFGKKGNQ